jgi:hypothetical protein
MCAFKRHVVLRVYNMSIEEHYRALIAPISGNLHQLVEHERLLFESSLALIKIRDTIEVNKQKVIEYFEELNKKLDQDHQIETINVKGRTISVRKTKTKQMPTKKDILNIIKLNLPPIDYENILSLIKSEESEPEVHTVLRIDRTEEEKEAKRRIMDSRVIKPKKK